MNLPRASRTSKKVGPVQKTGVLEEEPGSSKPIFYIWVLYGLNTGFVRFKYGFCADETHLFWQKPGFSRKLKKNRVFEKTPTNLWVLEALGCCRPGLSTTDKELVELIHVSFQNTNVLPFTNKSKCINSQSTNELLLHVYITYVIMT